MNRFFRIIFSLGILLILIFLLKIHALALKGVPELYSEIEKIIQSHKVNRDSLGLAIQDLKTGEIIYHFQPQRSFIPASNIKLITSAASLTTLGPNYTFKTLALSDSPIRDGILDGDLYIKGFGDPFLVSEELWLLAREVKNFGIKQINGHIIGDESYFDYERTGPAWPGGDILEPYKPQISALSLNFNTISFHLTPGAKVGIPIKVSLDPEGEYTRVFNQALTGNNRSNSSIYFERVVKEDSDLFTIKGSVGINSKPQKTYRNVSRPALYTTSTFLEFLKKEGLTIKGRALVGLAPPSAKVVAAHSSKPLSAIIADMNKFSNNFTAEQVLKALGAELEGPPGTWKKGLKVMREFLTLVGIPEGEYTIEDGSGLSRLNRFSPEQFLRVLNYMYRDFKLQPEYVSSMAIMGIDGTAKKRFQGTPMEGKIRAKTGTLDGVKSLSGYAQARDGRILAFSVIINFKDNAGGDINGFLNRLGEVLINYSP